MKGIAIVLACLALFAALVCWRIGALIENSREPAHELVRIAKRAAYHANWPARVLDEFARTWRRD